MTAKKFTKKCYARAKLLFYVLNYCIFAVLVAVAVVVAKAPYYLSTTGESLFTFFSSLEYAYKI